MDMFLLEISIDVEKQILDVLGITKGQEHASIAKLLNMSERTTVVLKCKYHKIAPPIQALNIAGLQKETAKSKQKTKIQYSSIKMYHTPQ